MFQQMYELLCGQNNDPAYATNIYPSVGLFTLIFAIVFALIFYVALGRWKNVWYTRIHWVITLVLLAALSAVFGMFQAKGETASDSFDSFMIKFGLINALYAVVYFILLSLLLKRFSIYSKRTPL
jgi:hypothetical protein